MSDELYLLDAAVCSAVALLAFLYSEKFLRAEFESRRAAILIWAAVYAAGLLILSEVTAQFSPLDRFFNVLPHFALIFLLQRKFFARDLPRQLFVAASFVAAWEILRFTASPLAHAIFSLWNPVWARILNDAVAANLAPVEQIISVMQLVNRAAIFFVIAFCRAIQLAILFVYLRTISAKFRRDWELKLHDAAFLILPCATVLAIDLTLRLMAFSADNGAFLLIFERAPATILLLPLVSLLLLGLVISSVILFENLVRREEAEKRRLLLENRVVEVHRQVEELSEIYGDIRGLRHDLRNHIENLAASVRGNSELENYLRRMTETVARLDFADKTGNAITDIILHQTRQRAKKSRINFDADFHFVARFDAYDVSVILNNALENALEACEKTGGGEIQLRSYERGGLYFIEVANNFTGEIRWNGDIPATTKTDTKNHGVGLTNIRRCAQKYLGEIEIDAARNIFRLTVMLYRKIDA